LRKYAYFNIFVVMVTIVPCKSYCYFYLLIQNGDVYTASKLTCSQNSKTGRGLTWPTVYLCEIFWNRYIAYYWHLECSSDV